MKVLSVKFNKDPFVATSGVGQLKSTFEAPMFDMETHQLGVLCRYNGKSFIVGTSLIETIEVVEPKLVKKA